MTFTRVPFHAGPFATGPFRSIDNSGPFEVDPALDLNFAEMARMALFDSRISFTRASNATMFDSQGRLVWAPANQALNTETLAGAAVGVIGSGGSLPTGWSWGTAATGLTREVVAIGTTSDGFPYIDVKLSGQNTSGGGSTPHISVNSATSTANQYTAGQLIGISAWTQLIDGTLNSSTSGRMAIQWRDSVGNYLSENSSFASRPDGTFRRNSHAAIAAVASTNRITANVVQMSVAAGETVSYTIRISRPQVELIGVDFPKAYSPNTSTTSSWWGPRLDYNPATLAARGLLVEPDARTNLITNVATLSSTGAGSASAGPGKDGYATSILAGTGAAGAVTGISTNHVYTGSTVHTVSVIVKKREARYVQIAATINASTANDYVNFDLDTGTLSAGSSATGTITPIGGSYFRVSMTWTTTAAPTTGSAVVVYIVQNLAALRGPAFATTDSVEWGWPQSEAGAFPTSFIPTFGSTAQRVAETPTLDTTNITTAIGNGTMAVSVATAAAPLDVSRRFAALSVGGASANYVALTRSVSPSIQVISAVSSSTDFGPNSTGGAVFTAFNTSVLWDQTVGKKLSVNGAAVSVDATLTANLAYTQLSIGTAPGTSSYLNGWISRIRYWPHANFTDAQLQALSA